MREGGAPTTVVWHDLECGRYRADLPLWRTLAADPLRPAGPVLDVGAGTGRVTLDLLAAGHEVVALDVDPELLAVLRERAGRLPVATVTADARAFTLARRFGLILAPMQTVQLIDDLDAFLRCARDHLSPGGLLACALAEAVPFDESVPPLPPDRREAGGWTYSSLPVAVRETEEGAWLERLRETVSPTGECACTTDRVLLRHLAPRELEAAGRALGFQTLPRHAIASTDDHVGSEVVILRHD